VRQGRLENLPYTSSATSMIYPIHRTLDVLINGLVEKVGYKFNLPCPIIGGIEKLQKRNDKRLMRAELIGRNDI
jgi:hypothetical protein